MAIPSAAYTRSIAFGTASVKAKLAALSEAEIDLAIEEAALPYTAITSWTKHTQVVALHALHILATSGAFGAPAIGPVTSAGAGGVSQSVAVSSVTLEGNLDTSTPWGRRALKLLKGRTPSIRAARGGYSPYV